VAVAAEVANTPAAFFARWRTRILRHVPDDRDEVRLHHSRIYILPTRRGLAFIATVATMVVASLNYGLALGFVVTFLLAGLCTAALLHTFRNVAGLAVRPGSAGEAFAGGSVPFTLHLCSGDRERVGIVLGARRVAAAPVDVAPGATRTVTLDVPAPSRGILPLGRVTIASDHPLGLWRAWSYVHFPLDGLAYPAPEAGAPALPAASAGDDEQGAGRREEGDLAGLRAYQRGDPLQRVAWKTVARGSGWYTKQFDGAAGGGDMVLDFDALPARLDSERRLERLCAWVLACERCARACALVLPGERVPMGLGREHRRRLLAALARHPSP
jgi:uncharacterized protein (DUF58 family)